MSKKVSFRVFVALVSVILMIGATWILLPTTSAQKVGKSILATPSSPSSVSSVSDDDSLILLNATAINVHSAEAQAERKSVVGVAGKQMHLVRFRGPIHPEWYRMLQNQGLEIIDYIPNYTYLVYGSAASIGGMQTQAMKSKSPIEWDGPYKDEYRISHDVFVSKDKSGQLSPASDRVQVQLYKDPSANADTMNLIDSVKTEPVIGQQEVMHYVNFVVGLDKVGIDALASRPDVISIHRYSAPVKLDERQDIILAGNITSNAPTPGDYLAYLAGKGLTQAQFDTSNFLVDLSDSGVDTATPATPNEFVFRRSGDPTLASRFTYSRLEGTANSGSTLQGCDGHGNLNASIIAGYVPGGGIFAAFPHADASAFRYGLGVAPFVKFGNSVIFDPDFFTSPNYANLQSKAYNNGARISSNSWGSDSSDYTTDAQSYDALVRDAQPTGSTFATAGNQEMVIVFAAGNSGNNGAFSVGSPSTGKNVITVGASEGVQAFGAADQCGVPDSQANSAFDMATFSGRGPTSDGRKKPDIVLPGTHVSGTVAQASNVTPVSGNGSHLTCYNASGVCAGPGTSDYWPLSQEWYTASSGTSHSTPAISGYAALIRQDFINRGFTPPSPAITKALIMNSARYMTGSGANDSLPSNNQGMGLANMNSYFDTITQPNILRDEVGADRFTASAQQRIFVGNIVDNTRPTRVTLAWTDAPGSTTGNAFVNNLDLEVVVNGNGNGYTYLGNVFNGSSSVPDGSPDTRNNVESVFIPAGVTGKIAIKVKATNIAGDGVPNNADALDQDFALIASNTSASTLSVVQTNSVNITAENAVPANGAPDPGETVTVSLALQEVGTANSGAVTATLQNSGGIIPVTTVQNYGVMNIGGPAVALPFTFKVPSGSPCGGQISLTFVIQDGAASFSSTKTLTLGTLAVSSSENFDGVTAPALPAGWVNTLTAGTGVSWVTTATAPNSAPNAVFANDPTTLGAATLESPTFAINSSSATVTFKNSYNTEFEPTDPTLGYDGAILEIKIGAGSYQEIISAGGSFISGAYNRRISSDFSSPIAGHRAWSGNSGGYVDTAIAIPPSANGQNIRLRWTMASDDGNIVSVTGVKIDDLKIFGGYSCGTAANTRKARADFDGDGRTDESVFRPSDGNWYAIKSGGGILVQNWGIGTDIQVPGDYDNDNKTDVAVFRPSDGNWYVIRSSDSTVDVVQWGTNGDRPVAGDYDGDGKTDRAVFRPSDGNWYIIGTTSGVQIVNWGVASDRQVPADYDGDGKTDVAVFRPSDGNWYIIGTTSGLKIVNWGVGSDRQVPADYDNDGKTDVAVFRPSDGNWYIIGTTSGVQVVNWGVASDITVPGDYDGDGKNDVAVFRPSDGNWYIIGTTSGVQVVHWGTNGDVPIPTKYIP
jgi:hypothetical protein